MNTSIKSIIVSLFLVGAAPCFAAELELRESLLQQQANLVTITVKASVSADTIGSVHPLDTSAPLSGKDCDIHMGLDSDDIRVPFVGEIQNACSIKPSGSPNWKKAIVAAAPDRSAKFVGIFRLWLEHPPANAQSEAHQEHLDGSNPDHQVELHPLLQIGSMDLRSHVHWIEKSSDEEGYGYSPDEFRNVLGWTITLQRVTINQVDYIRIDGKKFAYNHWTLNARATAAPETLSDGVRVKVDILDDGDTILAQDVDLVAATGTDGGTKLAALGVGQKFEFLGLSTIDPLKLVSEVTDDAKDVPVPIAFIVLDTR